MRNNMKLSNSQKKAVGANLLLKLILLYVEIALDLEPFILKRNEKGFHWNDRNGEDKWS